VKAWADSLAHLPNLSAEEHRAVAALHEAVERWKRSDGPFYQHVGAEEKVYCSKSCRGRWEARQVDTVVIASNVQTDMCIPLASAAERCSSRHATNAGPWLGEVIIVWSAVL
jgi:hypothetical protein